MSRYADADAAIHELALRQHGVVSRRQVARAGLSAKARRVRIEQRRLVELHGGRALRVLAVADSDDQSVMAAVLAAGATAFASLSSAAALFELPVAHQSRPEVTVVYERTPRIPGVRVHRSALLVERDLTTVRGVPVSTPERTIVDLSGRLTSAQLGRVADDALRRRLTTLPRIAWCIERVGSAPGRSARKVETLLAARRRDGGVRESLLEDFVYEAIGAHGLPLPRCQHPVEVHGRRYRVDMAYEAQRVAIEVDGFDAHRDRRPFDRDRARGNDIVLLGYTLLRFTSAFNDWQIACTVADALSVPRPPRPVEPRRFDHRPCL
jgi:very-short-patch-repair endonuclease